MKKFLAILALCLSFWGCRNDKLVEYPDCPKECYDGPEWVAGVGICKKGVPVCNEKNEIVECKGYVLPDPEEVCDGLDNDCNGITDEFLTRECESACGTGEEFCRDGNWIGCDAPQPQPETCNGLDDNCNGEVDELPPTPCYEGPPDTLGFPPCGYGTLRCINAQTICQGQILPAREICDGLDNDCDGEINEGMAHTGNYDIVFAVDSSGSMGSTIRSITNAAVQFSSAYQHEAYKFALLGIPFGEPSDDGKVTLVSNFTDAASFATQMQNVYDRGLVWEPNWDVPVLVANYTENPLGLTWRPGSIRILVVFTDERGQSYLDPQNNEFTATTAVAGAGLRTYIFTRWDFRDDFDDIAYQSGGDIYDVQRGAQGILGDLNDILKELCEIGR